MKIWNEMLLGAALMGVVASQASATERWVPSPNYPTIQSAISAAVDGDEVIIEPNTYTGDGNRDIDFMGKALTVRCTDPNDPNVVAATVIDCEGSESDPHRGFTFHGGEDANSVVAGLTITNGYAQADYSDDPNGWGGGVYCSASSPTVTDCTFSGNTAICGGGIYNDANSNLTVTNCTFSGNTAESGGGMQNEVSSPTVTDCIFSENTAWFGGGGMHNEGNSSPTVTDCTFSGNEAEYDGAGMCNDYGSSPTVSNCTFSGNTADSGGGMYNAHNSSPRVTSCTFGGNTALLAGGGMATWYSGSPEVTNCTFSGNTADYWGGGMYNYTINPTVTNCTFSRNAAVNWGGGIHNNNSNPTVRSCILWSNTPDQIDDRYNSTSLVTYACIEGGWPGPNNISDDPLFVDPNGPDGDPNAWEDNDYHLSPNSPCIDAGDPNGDYTGQTDIDGQGRTDGVVDMGSDEVWPDVNYVLTLKIANDPWGDVALDPEPNDPNLLEYSAGTLVTLTAEPVGNKSFKKWKLWDPNDANYFVIDTNNPITIVMSADRKVKAVFKCGGGGMAPLLATMLGVLGLHVLARRRR